MSPRSDRPAVSTTTVAILVIIVIIVGGAIGIFYPRASQKAPAASTTSTSGSSTSASSSTAATSSTTSSSVNSTATRTPPAPSPPLFNFSLVVGPNTILMSPGSTLIYPSIYVTPAPNALQGQAALDLGIGDELVVLNAMVPTGISVNFFGSNLTGIIYQEVSAGPPTSVELQVATAQGITPGNYPVTIEGSSGTLSVNYSFTVQVVKYLITAQYGIFSPNNLNVTAGSTVFWINISTDKAADYNVVFNTINVQSNALNPCPSCDVFSYTFTTPGTYSYVSNSLGLQAGMKGTITVTG